MPLGPLVPGEVVKTDLGDENGFVVYSVEVKGSDGTVTEVKVDAGNGQVLYKGTEVKTLIRDRMVVRVSGKKVPNKQVDGVVPESGAAYLVRVRRRPAIDRRTGKHGIRSAHRAGLSGKNELRVAQAERQAEGLVAGGVEGRLRGWLEP